jgi:hypothetical protein
MLDRLAGEFFVVVINFIDTSFIIYTCFIRQSYPSKPDRESTILSSDRSMDGMAKFLIKRVLRWRRSKPPPS